jgi:hypothetical protein
VPAAGAVCADLPATNPCATPPKSAVAEQATPAFEACFKNRRLEEENLGMAPFPASSSQSKALRGRGKYCTHNAGIH